MAMQQIQVGKFKVCYTPELELATVQKPGLLVPEVVHEEHGRDDALAAAIRWAQSNVISEKEPC